MMGGIHVDLAPKKLHFPGASIKLAKEGDTGIQFAYRRN